MEWFYKQCPIYRFKANSFVYNTKEEFWSFALGWGNMDENDYILDSGFMFGFFESGPWLSAKFSKNPAMAWIGGGTKSYEIGVTVFSIQYFLVVRFLRFGDIFVSL